MKIRYKLMKKGNVFIPIGILVLVIVVATVVLVYTQINIIIENVRRDLFYAANSAVLSFDLQELSYKKYSINENKTKEVIEYLLNKNYANNNGNVTKIQVKDLHIEKEQEKVLIKTKIRVTFVSAISIAGIKEYSFNMNENIKISLMDY